MADDKKIYTLEIEIGDSKKVLEDLRLEIARVNNELKKGNLTKEEAKKKTTELKEQEIDEKKKLQELNQELKNEKKALNEEKSATKEAAEKKNILKKSIDKTTEAYHKAGGGIKGMTAAAKAFILTPIGAAITAITTGLGLLKKALGGSVEGQRTLNKITKTVSATFDVFLQKVRDLGSLLKAVGTGLTGGGWDDFFNVLNNTIDPIATIKEAVELEDKLFQLELKESELRVKQSEYEKEISEQRRIAADQSKTAAEREAANQKVRDLTVKSIDEEIALEQERLDLLKKKHSLTDSTKEDIQEEQETQIRINELIAQKNSELQKTDKIQNRINKSIETMKDEADKATKAWVDAGKKALEELDKTLKKEEELRKTNTEKVKSLNNELFSETLDEHQRKLWNIQEEYNARMDSIKELAEAQAISDAERKILEDKALQNRKNKEKEVASKYTTTWQEAYAKAAASAINQADIYSSATINTIKAISAIRNKDDEKAFKMNQALEIGATVNDTIAGSAMAFIKCVADYGVPYGAILGGIAAGSATASGVAAIAKIKSQKFGGGGGSASSSTPAARSVSVPQETTASSKIQGVQSDLAMAGQTRSVIRSEERKTQTVLVVDDVTAKQNSQNLIQKTSVM